MKKSIVNEVVGCRICASEELEQVFDLGQQSLGSLFPGPGEGSPPSASLEGVQCHVCGLVQLRHSVDRDKLYTYGYGYRSGTNVSMSNHLKELASWVEARRPLQPGDTIVDIGCNDGTLLKTYRGDGLTRIGIDPIANKFAEEHAGVIQAYEDFFGRGIPIVKSLTGQVKIVTSISMFYDLDQPNDFVAAIHDILAPDGIWVLEQSYLPLMLERNAFDTICHEHLEYYALAQIKILAARHQLRVFDVVLNDCNGGSFRVAVCHATGPFSENRAALAALEQWETALQLHTSAPLKLFAQRIQVIREQLVAWVQKENRLGKKIYLYGASTKGNTLLQYCGLDHTMIVAAADRNPDKWGCRTPLTDIPILSEEEARCNKPDYFLVLPWHFREEFIVREESFLKGGGQLVFPLPRFDCVGYSSPVASG